MKKAVTILENIISYGSLAYSLVVLFAVLANIAEPELRYVNATGFGTLMIGYSVTVVLSASVFFALRGRGGAKRTLTDELLPHGALVLSVTALTLSITNIFNRTMSFVTSELSVAFILIYATWSLLLALRSIECLYSNYES